MNFESIDYTNLLYVIFRISLAFFTLLHALFVLFVARQIMNMKGLLSTLKNDLVVLFAFIHAIILLALLLYICFLPQQ